MFGKGSVWPTKADNGILKTREGWKALKRWVRCSLPNGTITCFKHALVLQLIARGISCQSCQLGVMQGKPNSLHYYNIHCQVSSKSVVRFNASHTGCESLCIPVPWLSLLIRSWQCGLCFVFTQKCLFSSSASLSKFEVQFLF